MKTARPYLVPLSPEPIEERISIDEQWRAEIKARDWKRVHLDGDRRAPVSIGRRLWQYTFPTSRKVKS